MKNAIIAAATLLLGSTVLTAKEYKVRSLAEKKAIALTSSVSKVVVLGQNKVTDKTYRLLLIDHGQSTDVSPRYEVQLTYFHGDEGNNTQTAFSLGRFFELVSTKRVAAGIYEISVKEVSERGELRNVTLKANVHQVARDDNKLRESLEFLDDRYFQSTITVTR